ncbi:MAG: response regulator transcription factor [Clostridiales bacterium]|nr:response regulator transcription factor [Clostridiales bacterium]
MSEEKKVRIAVCDDIPEEAGSIGSTVLKAARELRMSAGVELFTSASSLLRKVEEDLRTSGKTYDIIFTDIKLPEMDGIVFGKKLYSMHVDTALVLVTAYPEYAIDGYGTHAFQFLTKPVTLTAARDVISAILSEKDSAMTISVSSSGRHEIIPVKDIDIIAAEDKYVRIYAGGRSFLDTSSLDQLEVSLMRYGFVRVHRSTLVNIRYYRSLEGSTIYLTSGRSATVSRRRIPEIRKNIRNELQSRII